MKEHKRRRSLSGAVLIMVLTVMFVLIILLMATLTTVTTANQRIYTKFEENQAYYTARSALDVFTQNMLGDGSYFSSKTYDYTDRNAATPVIKTGKQMKQGLALQHDLYKIQSQCETYGKDASTNKAKMKFAENMESTDAVNIFSAANMGLGTGTPPEAGYFAVETATPLNKEDAASKKQFDYIEYQVTLPAMSNSTDSYGRFVDTNSSNEQIAKIKVEVLDRIYATDPSYTSDQIKAYFGGDHSVIPDDATLMTAIAKGSRSKDYMKLRITSTVTVMGTEGVAVVIVETTKKDPPANKQALTTSGTATGRGGSSPGIEGGFSTMALDKTDLISGDEMCGLIFSIGSFGTATSGCRICLDEGSSIVAMKGLDIPSGSTTIRATDDKRFMFLGGTNNLHGKIGDSSNVISMIADTITSKNGATLEYHGNIYANKVIFDGKNMTVSDGKTYVNEIVTPPDTEWSKWLSIGADDGKIHISQDMAEAFTSMNFVLNSGFTIHNSDNSIILNASNIGDVVIENNKDFKYTKESFGKINFSNDPAVGTYTAVVKDERIYRKYTDLPFSIDGKNEVEIPTPQSFFKDYYIDGAFNPASGDLGKYNATTGKVDFSVTDYDTIYNEDNNVIKLLKTGAMLFEDYLVDENPSYVRKNTIDDIIDSDPSKYPTWTDSMANSPIDLSAGDQYFVLSGTYQKPITVTGGGEGRLIFLIREGDTVTFDGIGSGLTVTTDYINATQNSIETGITKAPAVDFYGGTDSNFKFTNQCTIAGYIVMPTGDIKIENGKIGMTYDGATANNTFLVGSILCRSFDAGNHPKILYLDKDSGADIPGEPFLNVKSSQYVRS